MEYFSIYQHLFVSVLFAHLSMIKPDGVKLILQSEEQHQIVVNSLPSSLPAQSSNLSVSVLPVAPCGRLSV